jgi:outer membrane immunogenic protein
MQKIWQSLTLAFAGVAISGSAMAADIVRPPPVAPAPIVVVAPRAYEWSGPYIGIEGGYAWGHKVWQGTDTGGTYAGQPFDVKGWLGGIHGGFDGQRNNLVFGINGSFDWANITGSTSLCYDQFQGSPPGTPGYTDVCSIKADWLATLSGRIGGAFNRTLVYVKGGAAFIHENLRDDNLPDSLYTGSATKTGWLIGVGVEQAINDRWSVGIEYDYIDFGNRGSTITHVDGTVGGLPPTATVNLRQTINVVKGSLNFRF